MHTYFTRLSSQHLLHLTVQHQHKGGTDGSEGVSSSTLEKSVHALLLQNLGEAIGGTLVQPLVLGLLGLHLQTSADGIERVRSITGSDGSGLSDGELGGKAEDGLVLSVGVDAGQGIVHTEVHTTVRDDTHHRHTETVVKTQNTRRTLSSLHKAVSKTVERLLLTTNIGSKSGTGIVQRIDNAQRSSTSKTTGGHVGQEKHKELLLGIISGEHVLEGILEGKVKSLGREVADHVGEVTSPEGTQTLLLVHTGEAVANASVAGNLTRLDQGVGILGLDDKLNSLNRSGGSLGNGTGDSTSSEIGGKTLPEADLLLLLLDNLLLFGHFYSWFGFGYVE
mmetsp:Transcript_59119/g.116294  ORF Transcript_59119/g.116294 Transcript_59119/m.116294 type:complete len:336 (-) Transcript_59119:36-1043(-)